MEFQLRRSAAPEARGTAMPRVELHLAHPSQVGERGRPSYGLRKDESNRVILAKIATR